MGVRGGVRVSPRWRWARNARLTGRGKGAVVRFGTVGCGLPRVLSMDYTHYETSVAKTRRSVVGKTRECACYSLESDASLGLATTKAKSNHWGRRVTNTQPRPRMEAARTDRPPKQARPSTRGDIQNDVSEAQDPPLSPPRSSFPPYQIKSTWNVSKIRAATPPSSLRHRASLPPQASAYSTPFPPTTTRTPNRRSTPNPLAVTVS